MAVTPFGSGQFASATEGRGKYLRSPVVRQRPSTYGPKGRNIGLELLNIRDVEKIPGQLQAAYRLMIQSMLHELEVAAKSVVPKSPEGRLGRTVHARQLASGRIVVGTVGSVFAAALNRGYTVKPKRAKVLRFVNEKTGDLVFTMRTRTAGRHFFEKWVAMTGPIVEANYERSFYDIKHLSHG